MTASRLQALCKGYGLPWLAFAARRPVILLRPMRFGRPGPACKSVRIPTAAYRHQGVSFENMIRHRTPRPEATKPTGGDTSKQFALKLSEIELLVAIDVIRSAIAEHRKHLDLEVLRSVLAKLIVAYDRERGPAPRIGPQTRVLESIR
jgi:hypothetical protein